VPHDDTFSQGGAGGFGVVGGGGGVVGCGALEFDVGSHWGGVAPGSPEFFRAFTFAPPPSRWQSMADAGAGFLSAGGLMIPLRAGASDHLLWPVVDEVVRVWPFAGGFSFARLLAEIPDVPVAKFPSDSAPRLKSVRREWRKLILVGTLTNTRSSERTSPVARDCFVSAAPVRRTYIHVAAPPVLGGQSGASQRPSQIPATRMPAAPECSGGGGGGARCTLSVRRKFFTVDSPVVRSLLVQRETGSCAHFGASTGTGSIGQVADREVIHRSVP